LEGTYWKALELAGRTIGAQDPRREAHLQFQAGRLSGSDGCNRIRGSYQRDGDRVTFGQVAGTQMACLNPAGTEAPFRDALGKTARLSIEGDRLQLFDAGGTRLAGFAAAHASTASAAAGLAGTSWHLVRFEGGDDTVRTPDDRATYTIEFGTDGRVVARVDCNRGRGTWKSTGPGSIELGPLALTRAKCAAASLHDQIVRQWGSIRSYVIRDGHLFLALMADGGIYEFEPAATSTVQP
jgi:para-nitrobenzyl esterase